MRTTGRDRGRKTGQIRPEAGLRHRVATIGAVAGLLGGSASVAIVFTGRAYAELTVNVPCSPAAPGGGPAGLIAAMNNANAHGGGTINLAPVCTYSLGPNADNASNGLPVVKTAITINGNLSTVARSQVSDEFRIFEVDGPGSLTLNVLTVTGGLARNGGGILNTKGGALGTKGGTLTLNNSRVHDNAVTLSSAGKTSGGGIFNDNGGVVTVNNSRVDHNSATSTASTADPATAATAGGLYENDGSTIRLNNSRLDHNAVTATRQAFGGGIAIDFEGAPRTVVLNNSQVDNNLVATTASVGEIHSKGGGIQNNGTTLTLNSSRVINNAATAPGGEALGGGISSLTFKNSSQPDPDGLLSLNSSEVSGNFASGSSPAAGGGISNQVGTARITSSRVNGNTASATGAAGARGGGIENFQVPGAPAPSVTVAATQLSDNTANASTGPARGGGLFNSGSAMLSSSVVTGDRATGSPAQGGGIFNENGGSVTLVASLVAGNIPDNCFPHGTFAGCTS